MKAKKKKPQTEIQIWLKRNAIKMMNLCSMDNDEYLGVGNKQTNEKQMKSSSCTMHRHSIHSTITKK